jgi:hypothetical protein
MFRQTWEKHAHNIFVVHVIYLPGKNNNNQHSVIIGKIWGMYLSN